MTRRQSVGADESGETLIEILITLMILGITVTGLIAAMTLTVGGADAHRRLADSEIITRAYGEAIKERALHPPTTRLEDALGDHEVDDPVTFTVADGSDFTGPQPFLVNVGTEVIEVISGPPADTWFGTARGYGGHPDHSPVSLYVPCPQDTDLAPEDFQLPKGVSPNFEGPPLITDVEFFKPGGDKIDTACDEYWQSGPCGGTMRAYFVSCDPPLVKVTFEVESTGDTDESRKASTNSAILLRRGDA